MPYETDERLKGFLDTDQLSREQMCLALLGIDGRFTNVRPRHPRGGPDGGRDIEAMFESSKSAFGAVGFVNQANDSSDHKKKAAKKFHADLDAALVAAPTLDVFIFLTNVNLSVSEKEELTGEAKKRGLKYSEIFDRERLRILLDSPDGLSIRYQYLKLALSDAEQATFFARWGNDIQHVISEGFGQVQRILNRVEFLSESTAPLSHFRVTFEVDKEYEAALIGHFRAFCSIHLTSKNRLTQFLK
jgi:hypothetical protein